MRHPADGTLRRLLDEPAGVADPDREHIAGCPACRAKLITMKEDSVAVRNALDVEVAPNIDAAWQRLSQTECGPVRVRRRKSWRRAINRPLVAVVGVVAILSGASTAAATDWLQIFRAERVAPVTAPRADLISLPDLDEFGTLEVTSKVDLRPVADAGAAEKLTGLAVPRVAKLPRGVTGEPTYSAGAQASATFTFEVAKARRTVEATGATLPTPPPGLDGSRFRFVAGPGVVATWTRDRATPGLIVARAVAPAVYSADVPFATARDYVLSLPNVPESVASQLRGFSGDGTTLPLFVQVEKLTTSTADVNGAAATVLASRDRALAAVVWVDNGIVTAVAGPLSADEVVTVARNLRVGR
jgi:anti-sigma factor RsiW